MTAAAVTILLSKGQGLEGSAALAFDMSDGLWRVRNLFGPPIPPGTRFAANVRGLRFGVSWPGGQCIVALPPTPPAASFVMLRRRRGPQWKRATFLPLTSMADGDSFTLIARTPATSAGVRAILEAIAARCAAPQPEMMPLIELANEPRPIDLLFPGIRLEPGDPQWYFAPTLSIVGWTSVNEINAVIAKANGEIAPEAV